MDVMSPMLALKNVILYLTTIISFYLLLPQIVNEHLYASVTVDANTSHLVQTFLSHKFVDAIHVCMTMEGDGWPAEVEQAPASRKPKPARGKWKFTYGPPIGTTKFTYKGKAFWIHRKEGPKEGVQDDTIAISCFGRSTEPIKDLLTAAKESFEVRSNNKLVIYRPSRVFYRTEHELMALKPLRLLETVVQKPGLTKTIMDDIKDFLKSEKWYHARGVPYRRGYLFYGPPGTGKTSFCCAAASSLRWNISIVDLVNNPNTDIAKYLSSCPRHTIILIEDIDKQLENFGKKREPGAPTEADLLNAIDGVMAPEGTILVMTTNDLNGLNPALIRPGRVDRRFEFGKACSEQAAELFRLFYKADTEMDAIADTDDPADTANNTGIPTNDAIEGETFGKLTSDKYTAADIQGMLMGWKHDPQGLIHSLREQAAVGTSDSSTKATKKFTWW